MNRRLTIVLCCSLVITFLLSLSIRISQPVSPLHPGLHAMPAHPALLEKLQQEGKSLPGTAARYSRGIDVPQHMAAPPTGTFNLLVVAVEFQGKPRTVTPAFFDNLVFATPGIGVNSVADYYDEISRSTLTLVTVNPISSIAWITASRSYNGSAGYVNADTSSPGGDYDDYGFGLFPQNLQGIVWDVIPLIDPLVDFSQYDNDGDGFVDSVTFIHAGAGAEITGSASDIWSSAWNLSDNQGPGPRSTVDGVMIDNFSFEAEYMVNVSPTTSDQTIGMFCHELGHSLFGLPDLYDPDYSSNGVGQWSLMGSGAWNGPSNNGSSPAWPDAWSRTVMGFEVPTEITSNAPSQFIDPAETSTNPSSIVYKLWSPQLGPREYYLVENRQQVGYDVYLPGKGALIWHVDEDKWNQWEANLNECTNFALPSPLPGCSCLVWHYLVSLEQADGQYHLEKNLNTGDANDPYPFPYQQTPTPTTRDFMFSTTPESGSWYASTCPSDSCVAVKNISIFLPGLPGNPDLLMADFQVVCTSTNTCVNILPSPVQWIEGGGTASRIVSIQNCGPGQDIFNLSASSEWPVSFYNPANSQPITNLAIFAGATARVGVRVQVPESVGPGDSGVATMTVDPSAPGSSFTTTLTAQVPTCVLLVDDDRSQPDVEASYITSLLQNRFDFDYWDIDSMGNPSPDALSAHQSVIWFTGNWIYDTLHIRDEMALADYLDGGGQLFLTSQEYLTDTGRTSFNRNYLGVGQFLNDLGANSVQGVAGTLPWQNLGPFTLIPPAPSADWFNPLPGARAAFENENGFYNALAHDAGTWRSLFLSWPFENLAPLDASAVMTNTMDWLDIVPRPTVSFTVSAPQVCTGDVVTFTNTTTGGTRWWWDFGDGSTSTMTDTVHSYYFPFTATVTLKGKNCCGYEIITQSVEVVQSPWVTFTVSSNAVKVGDIVTFTSSVFDVTHLLWDFGDGMTSTLPNPTHIYTAPLTATVVLTGFSNYCGVSMAQKVILVESQPSVQPVAYLPLTVNQVPAMRVKSQPLHHQGGGWEMVVLPVLILSLAIRTDRKRLRHWLNYYTISINK